MKIGPVLRRRIESQLAFCDVIAQRNTQGEARLRSLLSNWSGGDPTVEITSIRSALGSLLVAAGRFHEAIDVVERGLEDEAVIGPENPVFQTMRLDLALCLAETGEHDRAVAIVDETQAQILAFFGPDHPRSVRARLSQAHIYNFAGQTDASVALYEEMIPRAETLLGPDHPTTISANETYGIHLLGIGEVDRAYELFRRGFEHRQRFGTLASRPGMRNAMNLSMAHAHRGEWAESVELLDVVAPIARDTLDDRDLLLAAILHGRGAALSEFARFDEAERDLLDAYDIAVRSAGIGHPRSERIAVDAAVLYIYWIRPIDTAGAWAQYLLNGT